MTLAFVFPGQGSQFVGMGAELARIRPIFRGHFDRADETLGFSLKQLCFEGPESDLGDTYNTQSAIYTHSVAAYAMTEMSGELPQPAFLAGHSLGEFSALCAAGVFEFEDGLRLVRERGRLMKQAGVRLAGSMAAVMGSDMSAVREICAEASAKVGGLGVVPANDNCPGQIVISGTKEGVAEASAIAKARGIKRVIELKVSIASHSPLMASMADEFRQWVERTPMRVARTPVVANTTVQPITHPDDVRAELCAQLTSPVRWTESVQWMHAQGVTQFVELGPKDVLSNLIKRTVEGATLMQVG